MKVREIIDVIECAAPLCIQESYDNSGLIVGDPDAVINSALLCVDITERVLDEAITKGSGLIISHHPIIFHAIKRLTGNNYIERVVVKAIQNNIALYACHTNLDQIEGGLSYRVATMLGIEPERVLSETGPEVGFGIVGNLPAPMPMSEFMQHLQTTLSVKTIRHSDFCKNEISRVAISTGSGASLMTAAKNSGADIYISADFKYNDFLDADNRIIIADVGHFESEYCAIEVLYDIITKKITTFALHKSENSVNPINYFV